MGRYIPKVSRKALLLISGFAWLGTSIVLISNVVYNILPDDTRLIFKLAICFPIGLVLYFLIFNRVPRRYIERIINLEVKKTWFFAIMGVRGYIVLIVMAFLTFGLLLYRAIDPDYVFTFQSIMCIPILISALLFFKAWKKY